MIILQFVMEKFKLTICNGKKLSFHCLYIMFVEVDVCFLSDYVDCKFETEGNVSVVPTRPRAVISTAVIFYTRWVLWFTICMDTMDSMDRMPWAVKHYTRYPQYSAPQAAHPHPKSDQLHTLKAYVLVLRLHTFKMLLYCFGAFKGAFIHCHS